MASKRGGGLTDLGALRRVDAKRWAREIRRAMKAHGGRVPDAAAELGVSERTLYLWLKDPALETVPRAPMGPKRPAS